MLLGTLGKHSFRCIRFVHRIDQSGGSAHLFMLWRVGGSSSVQLQWNMKWPHWHPSESWKQPQGDRVKSTMRVRVNIVVPWRFGGLQWAAAGNAVAQWDRETCVLWSLTVGPSFARTKSGCDEHMPGMSNQAEGWATTAMVFGQSRMRERDWILPRDGRTDWLGSSEDRGQ